MLIGKKLPLKHLKNFYSSELKKYGNGSYQKSFLYSITSDSNRGNISSTNDVSSIFFLEQNYQEYSGDYQMRVNDSMTKINEKKCTTIQSLSHFPQLKLSTELEKVIKQKEKIFGIRRVPVRWNVLEEAFQNSGRTNKYEIISKKLLKREFSSNKINSASNNGDLHKEGFIKAGTKKTHLERIWCLLWNKRVLGALILIATLSILAKWIVSRMFKFYLPPKLQIAYTIPGLENDMEIFLQQNLKKIENSLLTVVEGEHGIGVSTLLKYYHNKLRSQNIPVLYIENFNAEDVEINFNGDWSHVHQFVEDQPKEMKPVFIIDNFSNLFHLEQKLGFSQNEITVLEPNKGVTDAFYHLRNISDAGGRVILVSSDPGVTQRIKEFHGATLRVITFNIRPRDFATMENMIFLNELELRPEFNKFNSTSEAKRWISQFDGNLKYLANFLSTPSIKNIDDYLDVQRISLRHDLDEMLHNHSKSLTELKVLLEKYDLNKWTEITTKEGFRLLNCLKCLQQNNFVISQNNRKWKIKYPIIMEVLQEKFHFKNENLREESL
jgi:hypothetical protein